MLENLGKKVIVFDGAMGSELERMNLVGVPEELNLTAPEAIISVHKSYASADVITANTFGLNPIKYRGKYPLEKLAKAAVSNARTVGKPVFFDVGPTGAMTRPLGELTFDEAYEAYRTVALVSRELADGYIVETFSDMYELKACVLALKENTDLPVFVTATFAADGRTLTGTSPAIFALEMQGLGADAIGVNCSLGPAELVPIVEELLSSTDLPVIVQPNMGIPELVDGAARYNLGADEFDRYAKKFVEMGVAVLGGCCGTTPEIIDLISKYRGTPVKKREFKPVTAVASSTRLVRIEGVKVCGERINPTGKKALAEALKNGDYAYLEDEAVRQRECGADLLDLNAGVPGIDEPKVMREAVTRLREAVDLPLQIDSSDPAAIEAGVRYCDGVPIINSVNGERSVMERIFPIAKKYGAVVLGLAMDGRGVPGSAAERVEIAKKIIACAAEYGIPKHKIMIDTLVLTASAEQEKVKETLEALRPLAAEGIKTALGVSNVSFGLPARGLLNRTFLALALGCGLNMPIMNPLDGEMMGAVRAFGVLSASDKGAENYIEVYKDYRPSSAAPTLAVRSGERAEAGSLLECIKKGMKSRAAELTMRELENSDPMSLIDGVLMPALAEVGEEYDSGKLYLPQLVSAAEAAKIAFGVITERLPACAAEKGTVVLATVKGDVHDIGKNIVKVVAQSYGYSVVDLGRDVPESRVVEACLEYRPLAVGLSALMTTTVGSMERTIAALRESGCKAYICVGGAVLNAATAKRIGADYYTRDAQEFVRLLESLADKRRW